MLPFPAFSAHSPRQYTCSILCHPTLPPVFRTPPIVFRTPPIVFRNPPIVFHNPLTFFRNPPPVPCRFRATISRAQTASTVQTVVQTFPRKKRQTTPIQCPNAAFSCQKPPDTPLSCQKKAPYPCTFAKKS